MANVVKFKINGLTQALVNEHVAVIKGADYSVLKNDTTLNTDVAGNAEVEVNGGTVGDSVIVYCSDYPSQGSNMKGTTYAGILEAGSLPPVVGFTTIAFFGDSRTYLDGPAGKVSWGLFLSDGVMRTTDDYNFGIIADKTSDLLLRIQDVIDANPDVVHLCVGINDLESSSDSPEVIYARYEQIVNQLLAEGIAVTGERVAGTTTMTPERDADRLALNGYIAGNVNLSGVCGGDYDINPVTDTYDGVHYNSKGAIIRGQSFADMIKPLSSVSDVYADTSDNIYPSTLFNLDGVTGTDYQVAGDIADNLYIQCSAPELNATASKGTLNGNVSQVVTLNRTGDGVADDVLRILTNIGDTILPANSRYELVCDIHIVNNGTGLLTITSGEQNDAIGYMWADEATVTAFESINLTGVARSRSKVITSEHTQGQITLCSVKTWSVGDIDITVEVSRPYLREVI